MRRYFRPLGLLSGSAARRAVAEGRALALADGPLAYSLVEVIERSPNGITRYIISPQEGEVGPRGRVRGARRPLAEIAVMGIVNVTPDSFSDGGAFLDQARAIAHGKALIEAGAQILDIGGESTRPGATPVEPDEEQRRIVPVIAGLAEAANTASVLISVDTRNAATMRAALAAGASIVNDITALTHDPDSLAVVADSRADVVLMHMQGEPGTMQVAPAYADVVLDVYDYLESRIEACVAAGIGRSRIVVDPGIGFGKTTAHNLALIDQLSLFHGLGVPILVGVSRKGFIGRLSKGEPPEQRMPGSLALGLAALNQGAQILRVHDVAETVQAVCLLTALRDA
jgi:dihydropteroate synthase